MPDGKQLRKMLEETDLHLQISNDQKITTTKTRLVGQGGQHIIRWDREEKYKGKGAFDNLLHSVISNDFVVIRIVGMILMDVRVRYIF